MAYTLQLKYKKISQTEKSNYMLFPKNIQIHKYRRNENKKMEKAKPGK